LPSISVNGERRTVADGSTVSDLLQALGLETRRVAVEVEQELVPRARHGQHVLAEGERIEIVTLVGGG
jgi:sulfur carrier protein